MRYILILFFLISVDSYANKTKTISKNFGNIRVIFTSSFYYEEMNKALIIGQYAEELSKTLKYEYQVTLFFKHGIGSNTEVYYNVAHDEKNDPTKSNEIFITMKDSRFSVSSVLGLLEYSITNINTIGTWEGSKLIHDLNAHESSFVIKNTLNKKIYRPNIIDNLNKASNNAKYFYKNDKFHFYRIDSGKEEIILSLDDIFQLSDKGEYSYFLFDSIDSFYFITIDSRLGSISEKIEIKNTKGQYIPYKVRGISNQLTSITFIQFRSNKRERVALYDEEKQVLTQNILKLIK